MVMLFETSNLVTKEHRNENSVIYCLLELAKLAWTKFKIEPPSIIKAQEQIEKAQRKRSTTNTQLIDDTENAKINEEIKKICGRFKIKAPKQVQPGQYQTDDGKVLYVRVIRNIALVRHEGVWKNLESVLVTQKGPDGAKNIIRKYEIQPKEKTTETTKKDTKVKFAKDKP